MVATNLGEPVPETTEEDSTHIWSSLLKEVTNSGIGKLPQKKGLIVLGDNGSGKTTLLCRLNRESPSHKCPGLEYHYIDVKDDARCDQTKLSAFILGGDVAYMPLLKFVVDKNSFVDRMALITVSMDAPWDIINQLEKWARILDDYINLIGIPVEEMRELKENVARQFREYVEPDLILLNAPSSVATPAPSTEVTPKPGAATHPSGASLHPATAALLGLSSKVPQGAKLAEPNLDHGSEKRALSSNVVKELPITPGALVYNLGIPLVVVVTKTDTMDTLEKEKGISDEQFDLIQLHIRKFCLSYGAALFYVSAKDDKNCDLLGSYLQHRIYGFPFTQNAYVVEKDCIFIPVGWDSLKKIGILEENLTKFRPGDDFATVIPRPSHSQVSSSVNREPEVTATEEQVFLTRLYATIQRDNSASASATSAAAASATGTTGPAGDAGSTPLDAPSLDVNAGRPSSGSPRTAAAGALPERHSVSGAPGNVSEKLLANFFNNLLGKSPSNRHTPNTSANVDSTTASEREPDLTNQEMQSELERIAPGATTPSKSQAPAPDSTK